MYGAKAYRHIFLMERGLLIAKKKEDGNLMCKATIMVRFAINKSVTLRVVRASSLY